ncbi:hypothetical protein BDR04DRAFT_1122713 [Suillus decipiens]|nr:hypothetical protein BDR04DRAFT_1122713 [Suillus decipiens]
MAAFVEAQKRQRIVQKNLLEVTTHQSSRILFLNGSTENSSQIPWLTPMTNIHVDSPMMHAAGYSAWLSLTEMILYLSFPTYLDDKYTASPKDLEEGLFKSKILLQGYKAVFTSPSSAKDVKDDGDGTDVIQDNRHARKTVSMIKVKKHMAQIIKMRQVTLCSITYITCQVWFALSSVTSWRSVDGDFDYV